MSDIITKASKAKNIKTIYECQHCGNQQAKWVGQCQDCQAWNSFSEVAIAAAIPTTNPSINSFRGYAGVDTNKVQDFNEIDLEESVKITTGISELDRVLGGGLVSGSVILIGGDPGIGKSTLLLQAADILAQNLDVLYVTGEESLQQVVLRGARLDITDTNIKLFSEIQVDNIILQASKIKPKVIIIDSIQTICSSHINSAPGSVSQVRESASQLVQYAKQTGTALFLVGHVTKEGAIAGPRVLEHMVDTVLYFEGQGDNRYRVLRAVKNRFGAVNELGLFVMGDKGLKAVTNPSAIFLQKTEVPTAGSIVTASWEGTRPLLVEVQALVDQSHLGNPRRICVGIEHARLIMCLAVLHRHSGIFTYDQDVFINVVGGVKIDETAADLAIACAVISSLKNKPIPNDTIIMGELGLGGELRPIQSAAMRLQEAQKHGFKTAILPKLNLPKGEFPGLKIFTISNISEVLDLII
ncbi:MAG: DNA repair protein RadA [Gammaproteobacteria bacterium]|nr:DNA repair protein RadA [Gammaproteobacteria bacterium]